MAKSDLIVRMSGNDKNLQKALNNAKKGMKDFGKTSDVLDDVNKAFEKTTSSNAKLSRKIADIKKQMEMLAMSEKASTAEGKKMWDTLSKQAQQYDATLKKIQQDTKSVQASSKGGFDIKQLGGDVLNKAGLGSLTSTLVNPYTAAAGAIVVAGKALNDYNKELDRSLQKTAQFTGLSGNELNSLRHGIKSVADTFGKDYDTVLSSVDGLMAQFGMDAETALNIIRDGFVGGADDGGKMLDLISQYSGSFKDAGISASEMVAIIGNTRSGIFSEDGMKLIQDGAKNIRLMADTTISALSEIGINGAEMSQKLANGEMTTMQAIQKVSEKLKDIPQQSQAAGDVLKAVFGKQGSAAGVEFVKALSEVEINLDVVKGQTGEWGEAMLKLQEADRELEGALQAMFGVANGGWSEMGTIIKGEIYGAIAKVIKYFIELYNNCTIVRGGIQLIATTFKNAWTIIKSILTIFAKSLKGLGDMIEGVLTLDWDKVVSGWEKGVKGVLNTVVKGFEDIKKNANDMRNQTLNGKIEVSSTVSGSGEKPINLGNGNGGKYTHTDSGKSSSKSSKSTTEKATAEIGSIAELTQRLNKLNEELNNTTVSDERLKEIVDEKKALEEQIKALKIRNGLEKEAEKKEEKQKTPLELKRDKFNDANSKINQTKSDYANKLIDKSQAQSLIDEANAMLQEIGLQQLELHINDDGTITSKLEELEAYKEKMGELSGTIGSIGDVFGGLGDAIGGTGGKVMEFAGKTMEATAQIIPQIVSMIAAKQSEAMASGVASGASLPFPANIAAMASIMATVVSLFSSIPKGFAEGGIIGGNSMHGDKLYARVNSGEMILNQNQQSNLYRTLKNGNYGNGGMGGNVHFEISGTTLKGVLNNYDKKMSKIK